MIKLKYGSSVVALPGDVLGKLGSAGETELRVLVAVAGGKTETDEIASFCGIGSDEVNDALSFWRGAGILEDDGAHTKKRRITPSDDASRVYTGEEISKICENDKSVDMLIEKCRGILGAHVFTHAEASSVVYLRQGLGLEPEYIMLLCSHYAKREKVSMRFIEKKAISLYDEGIRTASALESYLGDDIKKHDAEYMIRNLFGLGERALIPKEKDYINNWIVKWNMSEELIRRAYEETVANTKTPTLAYANAILKSWHDDGVKSDEQAAEKKKEYKKKTSKKSSPAPGFDLDEFFDLAIARGDGSENS